MQRIRLCFEGWCYLALVAFIFGAALIREINLLLCVGGIMLGPLFMSRQLLTRFLSKLSVSRSLPYAVGVGEIFPIKLTATNSHPRLGAWGLTIHSQVRRLKPIPEPSTTQVAFMPFVRQRGEASESFDCRIHGRGAYEFGDVHVTSRFPLGLLQRTVVMQQATVVYVYPRLGRLRRQWLDTVESSNQGNRRSHHRLGFTEGEFHSLRDWRNSDSRRWIHWRTTARRNQLTVRQFERQRNRNLALLVELRDDELTNERLEKLIRFAATVVASHCRTGSSHLMLAIAGEECDVATGHSSAGMMRDCMDLLATANATRQDQLPKLLDEALDRMEPNTRIVLLSTQSVDLQDTQRFAHVWQQPAKRSVLRRVKCLRVDDEQFAAVFEEGTSSPQATESASRSLAASMNQGDNGYRSSGGSPEEHT